MLEVTNRSYAHTSVSKKLPRAATNVKFEYEYVLWVGPQVHQATNCYEYYTLLVKFSMRRKSEITVILFSLTSLSISYDLCKALH